MKHDFLNENLTMLDNIYQSRQEELGKCTKELKEKLSNVTEEEMYKILEKSIENTEEKEEILEKLDKLIENYEIKMAYFIEETYKQGFKDAFNLFMECEKK